MTFARQYRAGQSVEDHCRSCHEDRTHTVIVVDGNAQPLRVACDFCRSEHNYRGGPRNSPSVSTAPHKGVPYEQSRTPAPYQAPANPLPLVSEREFTSARASTSAKATADRTADKRQAPPMSDTSGGPSTELRASDLELLIRRIIREETGLTPVAPAEKWRGGEMVLRPGRPGVQEKSWPIESFFHKVVMLRNRLRTLEQQVNASDLPDDQKLKIQSYITGCYGSLTSFNVLFADEDDRFVGAAGQE
jgi:hypothetical protein